jgi:hypothetical protein
MRLLFSAQLKDGFLAVELQLQTAPGYYFFYEIDLSLLMPFYDFKVQSIFTF